MDNLNNFDYTDTDQTDGLPLGQPWERAAMKDLADIQHYLTHGLFINATDFADRLRNSADAVQEWSSAAERFPLFPPPPPERSIDLVVVQRVLGVHLAALQFCSDRLGVNLGDLMRYGKVRMENMSPAELQQLCQEALANE